MSNFFPSSLFASRFVKRKSVAPETILSRPEAKTHEKAIIRWSMFQHCVSGPQGRPEGNSQRIHGRILHNKEPRQGRNARISNVFFRPSRALYSAIAYQGFVSLPCDYYRVPDNIVTDSSHDCAYIWPRKRARRARKSPFQCPPCLLLWWSLWAVLRHSNVAIKCDSL
jgi:hypothetical protein